METTKRNAPTVSEVEHLVPLTNTPPYPDRLSRRLTGDEHGPHDGYARTQQRPTVHRAPHAPYPSSAYPPRTLTTHPTPEPDPTPRSLTGSVPSLTGSVREPAPLRQCFIDATSRCEGTDTLDSWSMLRQCCVDATWGTTCPAPTRRPMLRGCCVDATSVRVSSRRPLFDVLRRCCVTIWALWGLRRPENDDAAERQGRSRVRLRLARLPGERRRVKHAPKRKRSHQNQNGFRAERGHQGSTHVRDGASRGPLTVVALPWPAGGGGAAKRRRPTRPPGGGGAGRGCWGGGRGGGGGGRPPPHPPPPPPPPPGGAVVGHVTRTWVTSWGRVAAHL